ncbi:hypothetical protein KEM56_006472 [Ascosphaera pollenicola]|nr:hypothetical protein KEM56_006472 [Ascosphaera pollenicola]
MSAPSQSFSAHPQSDISMTDAPIKEEQHGAHDSLDDDIYEDTGDLDFSQAMQDVWLARLPKTLWEAWSKLDADEEIEVGALRVEGPPEDIKRISLRVAESVRTPLVPRDYNLRRQNVRADASFVVPNTYIFSEKDLPGHVDKANILFNETQTHGRSYLYEQMKKDANKKPSKSRKWEPYIRKTIPKSTAIVGKVHDEFNCQPVQNEEYNKIAEAMAFEALKPKKETMFLAKVTADMRNPKSAIAADKSTFIQTTQPKKTKVQDNKTTRIPQNELLDLIFNSFKKYRYWPFKALKEELRQPEAYIKQQLEMVAQLIRSGPYAMTWELRPEYRESNYELMAPQNSGAEIAPMMEGSPEEASDAEQGEEEVQFEDV